jgi:hypothetical protein
MARPIAYELEQLANQPGTYFNPQTEVIVVVDDSTSIAQDIFDSADFEAGEWVRITDEVPVDETALDEALEEFGSSYHPAGETVTAQAHDSDDAEDDPDLDRLDPDELDEDE